MSWETILIVWLAGGYLVIFAVGSSPRFGRERHTEWELLAWALAWPIGVVLFALAFASGIVVGAWRRLRRGKQ